MWKVAERRKGMDAIHFTTDARSSYKTREKVTLLFSLLDEGINDIENGKLISEKEMWAELDTV